MLTDCTKCQRLFQTRSNEYANEPGRLCPTCVGAATRPPQLTAELIAAVRAHARAHYNDGKGWDEIEEAFTDEELIEHLGNARTPAGAINAIGALVKIRHERAEDIRSTIW